MEYIAATEMVALVKQDVTITWNPPPPSMLKINVDGAISKCQNLVGVGSIIRDENGRMVAAMSRSIPAPYKKDRGGKRVALLTTAFWEAGIRELGKKFSFKEELEVRGE